MNTKILTPTDALKHNQNLRLKIANSRTSLTNGYIYDKLTGEEYGSYVLLEFSPETLVDTCSGSANTPWDISEDGSPPPPDQCYPAQSTRRAEVIELLPKQSVEQVAQKTSKAGRKPQSTPNYLAMALNVLILEVRTTWLDDFIFGAVCTGPGLVNGKHSVCQADVKTLLRQPVLSVANAAGCLLNHDRQPMSTRQLQRAVEAARIALRGVALHLERNPKILESVDMTVDFDKFWTSADGEHQTTNRGEHPKKQLALEMIRAGMPTKTTANKLGVSKNTIKKWSNEAQASPG